MNTKPTKVYALFFAALLVASILALPLTTALSGSFNGGEWNIRAGYEYKRHACAAAPGGTVTGSHANFEIWDKKGSKLFNLHVWLGYAPKIYISEGKFCAKIDQTTWKNLVNKIRDYLKTRLSSTAIKSLEEKIGEKMVIRIGVVPMMIMPNCENPSKYDIYSRVMCAGIGGTYAATSA